MRQVRSTNGRAEMPWLFPRALEFAGRQFLEPVLVQLGNLVALQPVPYRLPADLDGPRGLGLAPEVLYDLFWVHGAIQA